MPTVIVPVRSAVVVLAWTEKFTVPEPVPVLPEVTVIQLAFDTADQVQELAVVTVKEPVAAEADPAPPGRLRE